MNTSHDHAPGWDAIDSALAAVYGNREPDSHIAPIHPMMLGGDEPLHGISAYRVAAAGADGADGAAEHWHFVTYGYSELFQKQTDDPTFSGYGIEMTCRVALEPDSQDAPPDWCFSFLMNLARYVFRTGNVFGPGHSMPLHGPIRQGSDTLLTYVAFAPDPLLADSVIGPFGEFSFLQAVGITADDHQAMCNWDTAGVLELARQQDPLLITDLARRSWTDDPAFAAAAEDGSRREGSSQGGVFLADLAVDVGEDRSVEVRCGVTGARDMRRLLDRRLPFGRGFQMIARGAQIGLEPAFNEEPSALLLDANGNAILKLSADDVATLRDSLSTPVGTHTLESVPAFVLRIHPTEVRGQDGERVATIDS